MPHFYFTTLVWYAISISGVNTFCFILDPAYTGELLCVHYEVFPTYLYADMQLGTYIFNVRMYFIR